MGKAEAPVLMLHVAPRHHRHWLKYCSSRNKFKWESSTIRQHYNFL